MSIFFLTCKKLAESSIERFNIHKILNSCKDVTVRDLSDELKTWTDAVLDQEMCRLVSQGRVYALPEVPLRRMENHDYFDKIERITRKNIPGNLSVLAQVIAVTGYQPSRYDNLISAYAGGHIKALKSLGATTEEIKEITLRDRLLRHGGVFKYEIAAHDLIEQHSSVLNIHCYGETNLRVMDSIFDYHLAIDNKDLAIIFAKTDGEESSVITATIYLYNDNVIKEIYNDMDYYGYSFREGIDDYRTGLKAIHIAANPHNSRRISLDDLTDCIADSFRLQSPKV